MAVAATAIEAAAAQHAALPDQRFSADMVIRLAKAVIALNDEIAEIDALTESRFRQHRHAEIILSLPGFGPLLGAEFLAATVGT